MKIEHHKIQTTVYNAGKSTSIITYFIHNREHHHKPLAAHHILGALEIGCQHFATAPTLLFTALYIKHYYYSKRSVQYCVWYCAAHHFLGALPLGPMGGYTPLPLGGMGPLTPLGGMGPFPVLGGMGPFAALGPFASLGP